MLWPIAQVAGVLSLRIQQLDVVCETKTKDNVFVQVAVSVQYRILTEKVRVWGLGGREGGEANRSTYRLPQPEPIINPPPPAPHRTPQTYDAFYRLTDPTEQIRSYVYDVIRSTVPKMELDQAFESKADIAHSVQDQLQKVMNDYGYEIMESLVTDLSPDIRVKASMNEINASKRLKMASMHKAEADKIRQVKAAEAEAESRYLSGVGVARQRKAIVDGLQQSINDFKSDVKGTSPKDVMDLLLLTQYFDLLRDVGANTIFMQHEPDAVINLQKQVNGGFMKPTKSMFGK